MCRLLRPGGMLVGSSYFPDTKEQADANLAENPFHLHICTKGEMEKMLKKRFNKYHIYNNRLFFRAEK